MNGYLPPRILQATGLVILLFAVGFWAVTGQQSALLVGAALSLIGLGAYGTAQRNLKDAVRRGEGEDDPK
jgi:hypothetical protein